MKNNLQLVDYCKAQLGKPYWFGTFGQIATKKLLEEKSKQYFRQYTKKRQAIALENHLGKKVHDCYGLYKGFLMSEDPNSEAKYNKKYDIDADTAFNKAAEKGTIDTLPEIKGLGLWKKGHFGVYIGGGKEIEARGFDYGVIEAEVKSTEFTHWFKLPDIEYVGSEGNSEAQTPPIESTNSEKDTVYTVKKGDTLSKIAAKYGVTVADLVKWNSIEDPNLILIGQKIRLTSPVQVAVEEYEVAVVNTVKSPLRIRRAPSLNSEVIGLLPKGTKIKIKSVSGEWAKLYDREGYVYLDLIAFPK